MNESDFEPLYTQQELMLRDAPTDFHRYLYSEIDWDDRLIGIKGPRGAGKTTLLLQYLKEHFSGDRETAFYLSLDNLWVYSHDIMEAVEYLYTHGVRHLFLDEVHRFPHWQTLLKNLYDVYSQLSIVFTGSSMLEINQGEADLSRRAVIYELKGMSFREYLEIEGLATIQPLSLEELLKRHVEIAEDVCSKMSILPAFESYLKRGYYPFYKGSGSHYLENVRKTANMVIDVDYPKIRDVSQETLTKMKRMLMVIAARVPQTTNMSVLYQQIGTDRNQGIKMLYALEKAGLLALLSAKHKDLKHLNSPDKIYLDNTTLMFAMSTAPDTGTLRETFFYNQLSKDHDVLYPKQGDFLVDSKYLFEVGGKGKSFDQVKDIDNSYLAVADTEVGRKSRIPLWMFGLLY